MLNIKKGDQVKILAGKDRGKTGKVLVVDFKTSRATVEGRNVQIRHERPKKQGQKGQKIQLPAPMHISNLMLVCSSCGKPARIGIQKDDKGEKTRICKNCGKKV